MINDGAYIIVEDGKETLYGEEYHYRSFVRDALDIYKKLGFVQKGERREEGGIRYIPMVLER